jgi:hypothetical protein
LKNPLIDKKQTVKTNILPITAADLLFSDLNLGAAKAIKITEPAHIRFKNPMINPSATNWLPDCG